MSIVVYGSRELGRVVKHLLKECHLPFSGYIDDINTGQDIIGPFDEIYDRYPPDTYSIVNAVGYKNLNTRQKITDAIKKSGYDIPTIIHPTAYIAQDAIIGSGCIIMAHTVIDTYARLGENVVMWPGSVVNHDAVVMNNSFLSPNSTICGGAAVGSNCFIGAGAVVAEHRNVENATFLGALKIWK